MIIVISKFKNIIRMFIQNKFIIFYFCRNELYGFISTEIIFNMNSMLVILSMKEIQKNIHLNSIIKSS